MTETQKITLEEIKPKLLENIKGLTFDEQKQVFRHGRRSYRVTSLVETGNELDINFEPVCKTVQLTCMNVMFRADKLVYDGFNDYITYKDFKKQARMAKAEREGVPYVEPKPRVVLTPEEKEERRLNREALKEAKAEERKARRREFAKEYYKRVLKEKRAKARSTEPVKSICERCGKEVLSQRPRKYCDECRTQLRAEYNKEYVKTHKDTEAYKAGRKKVAERIAERMKTDEAYKEKRMGYGVTYRKKVDYNAWQMERYYKSRGGNVDEQMAEYYKRREQRNKDNTANGD